MRASTIPTAEIQERVDKMQRICGKHGIIGALESSDSDVLAAPSTTNPLVTFAARCGLPIVTVPLGFYAPDTPIKENKRGDLIERAPGVPWVTSPFALKCHRSFGLIRFCISFYGRACSEEQLIWVAYAFEQQTHVRDKRAPFLLPSIELRDIVGNKSAWWISRNALCKLCDDRTSILSTRDVKLLERRK